MEIMITKSLNNERKKTTENQLILACNHHMLKRCKPISALVKHDLAQQILGQTIRHAYQWMAIRKGQAISPGKASSFTTLVLWSSRSPFAKKRMRSLRHNPIWGRKWHHCFTSILINLHLIRIKGAEYFLQLWKLMSNRKIFHSNWVHLAEINLSSKRWSDHVYTQIHLCWSHLGQTQRQLLQRMN